MLPVLVDPTVFPWPLAALTPSPQGLSLQAVLLNSQFIFLLSPSPTPSTVWNRETKLLLGDN